MRTADPPEARQRRREGTARFLLRAALDDGPALAAALAGLRGVRSAHKDAVTGAVRVDPPDIGG